jgi:hypothetical protein
MNNARKLVIVSLAAAFAAADAQVPDLLTAFDAGGRAMGAGGAFNNTSADTLSSTYNPAGLGYVNGKVAGVGVRNFPKTNTTVTGPLNNLRLDSRTGSGGLRTSHGGYVTPLSGGRGTLGVSWTVGGYMNDEQLGTNLPNGIAQYFDAVRAITNFINVSYGKANPDMSFSWGVGLVLVAQQVYNRQFIRFTDPNIPIVDTEVEDEALGIGVQGGIMITPRNRPNMTYSLSVRSPIQLKATGAVALYQRIPARIAAGLVFRQDGFRGGRDFAVYGAEVQHFLSTRSSDRIIQDRHTTAHIGVEYNYHWNRTVIPIRLGYAYIPAGGDNFANRNTFTFGLGYRPIDKNWSVEFNFGRPNGGGSDTSIFVTYKP